MDVVIGAQHIAVGLVDLRVFVEHRVDLGRFGQLPQDRDDVLIDLVEPRHKHVPVELNAVQVVELRYIVGLVSFNSGRGSLELLRVRVSCNLRDDDFSRVLKPHHAWVVDVIKPAQIQDLRRMHVDTLRENNQLLLIVFRVVNKLHVASLFSQDPLPLDSVFDRTGRGFNEHVVE